ncbi:hypothetical protein ACF3M1_13100 [Luteimonas sp. WGS1318]|uniref:hypothetical protein n=1 Tax=Luteimonas sp. WGS1318 TaxID=3366815 RepID=UPI00372CFE12
MHATMPLVPHRLLAAFPDATTALFFLLVWLSPMTAGRASVFSAALLIGLELPALLALSGLFMLHVSAPWHDRLKAAACLCAALFFVGLFAIKAFQALPSGLLLVSVFAMLIGKGLIYTTTRRDSTWAIEGLKLAIHLGVLLLVVSIADHFSAAVPRGGFTDDVMRQLALPQEIIGRVQPDSPWAQPWWIVLAGALYFSLCAISRYAMAPETPDA